MAFSYCRTVTLTLFLAKLPIARLCTSANTPGKAGYSSGGGINGGVLQSITIFDVVMNNCSAEGVRGQGMLNVCFHFFGLTTLNEGGCINVQQSGQVKIDASDLSSCLSGSWMGGIGIWRVPRMEITNTKISNCSSQGMGGAIGVASVGSYVRCLLNGVT